jgi:hypothetical protein
MAVTPSVYPDTGYRRMLVFGPSHGGRTEEATMHPFLLEELAAARVQELRREAAVRRVHESRDLAVDPERYFLRVAVVRHPSIARRVAARSLHSFGFWLVGAGLRLAVAGSGRRAGR